MPRRIRRLASWLSKRSAAEVLGGGQRAVRRWESGRCGIEAETDQRSADSS